MRVWHNNKTTITLTAIFLAGILFHFLFFRFPLKGDEAVFGLMAKKILLGNNFPLYLWGAHYAGTLTAYLAALLFYFLGVSFFSLRLAGVFIWVGAFLGSVGLGKIVSLRFRPAELFFPLLFSFSPFWVIYYSSYTGGVYSESFLFGFAAIFLFFLLLSKKKTSLFFSFGLILGIGLWSSPHLMPYIFTFLILWLLRREKTGKIHYFVFFLAFLLGFLPAIIYSLNHPLAGIYRFGGKVFNLDRSFLSSSHKFLILAASLKLKIIAMAKLFVLFPFIFLRLWRFGNFANAVGISWFNFILVFLIIGYFYVYYAREIKKNGLKRSALDYPYASFFFYFGITYFFYFLIFITSERVRYLANFYIVFIFAAGFLFFHLRSRFLKAVLLFLILLINTLSIAGIFSLKERGYVPLMQFLEKGNINTGYADYDTAYSLVFLSNEKLIFSPDIFGIKNDRWKPYTKNVDVSSLPAYIFKSTKKRKISRFKSFLEKKKIGFKEAGVSGYRIFYQLTHPLRAKDLEKLWQER